MITKKLYILIIACLFSSVINQDLHAQNKEPVNRILFIFDASQSMREKWYLLGIKDIRLVWPFGYFMGDINNNYGNMCFH